MVNLNARVYSPTDLAEEDELAPLKEAARHPSEYGHAKLKVEGGGWRVVVMVVMVVGTP